MRNAILLALFAPLVLAVPHQAPAQHHGGAERGGSRGGHEFHGNRGDHEFNRNRGNGWGGSPYGYGFAYLPPYDDGYLPADVDNDYAYQPAPLDYYQQPPQPIQPPAARKPVRPVVQEYNWLAAGTTSSTSSPADAEPQTFAIVLKNGSTLSATMVLASADSLHYIDTDGRLQRVDLAEVDRAATLKLDRARNLSLYLPAAQ